MSSTADLTTKARFLRNASPRAFDEFYDALAEYNRVTTEFLVMATENWQLYQGHVQQCRKIMKALEEAKNG